MTEGNLRRKTTASANDSLKTDSPPHSDSFDSYVSSSDKLNSYTKTYIFTQFLSIRARRRFGSYMHYILIPSFPLRLFHELSRLLFLLRLLITLISCGMMSYTRAKTRFRDIVVLLSRERNRLILRISYNIWI